MTDRNQDDTRTGYFANFPFQGGHEWIRISADLGELGRTVGDQVRRALADVDFDAVRRDVDRALGQMTDGFRRASTEWSKSERWEGPGRIFVDIMAGKAPSEPPPAASDANQEERMMVVRLVAEGKITPEQGAKLLEALAR